MTIIIELHWKLSTLRESDVSHETMANYHKDSIKGRSSAIRERHTRRVSVHCCK